MDISITTILLTTLLVLALNIEQSSVDALSCPAPCDEEFKSTHCPVVSNCMYGVTKDMCGCCDECFHGENEPCGGIWGQGGQCASAYDCTQNETNWQFPGKCVPKINANFN